MASGEIRATITLDTSGFTSALSAATRAINGINNHTDKAEGSLSSMGRSLSTMGTQCIIAGSAIQQLFKPMAGILGESMQAAIDFESAFAGVKKTVDETPAGFQQLSDAIRDMSKRMPESADSIAEVMEIAGQLGIHGVDDLTKFTEVAVRLGDSTNMSSTNASTALARFLNITGGTTDEVDKLGSSLVHLGNNTATTESEIMQMSLRLAGAGRQVGISQADILGFAATLSSLGIRAEAGGSAFSKLMVNMEVACETGGESLEEFANVAGMSADSFKTKFKEDASGAIIAFLQGLKDIENNGGSMIATLDAMDIKEVRLRDTILRAAGGVDMFSKNLGIAEEAYVGFNSESGVTNKLLEESNKRYETMASQIDIFKNKLRDIGISIGQAVMPYLQKLLEWGNKLVDWLAGVNPLILAAVGAIGVLGVALGGLVLVFGLIASGIGGAMQAISTLGGAIASAATAISAPILIIVGAIVAVGAALVYCWKTSEEFRDTVTKAFEAVKTIIMEVVGGTWEVIKSAWGKIEPFVTKVFKNCADIIGDVFIIILDIVVPIVQAIWNVIKTVWGAIEPYVSGICSGIVDGVSGAWDMVYSIIKGVTDLVKALIKGDFSSIKDILQGVWDGVLDGAKAAWDGVFNVLKTFGDAIMAVVTPIWEGIKSFVTGICTGIKDTVSGIWDSIKQKINDVVQAISDFITPIWTAIRDAVTGAVQAIWEVIQPYWDVIYKCIANVCDLIWQVISIVWDVIYNIIENTCKVIWGVIEVAWNNVMAVTTAIWDGIKGVLTLAWNFISDKVKAGIDFVKPYIKAGWDWIKNITTGIWNNIKTFLSGIWDGIKNVVTIVTDSIKTGVSNAWNTIKDTTANIFNSVKETVSNIWKGVKSAILDPIKEAKDKLFGWIGDIVKGFANMKITIPKPKLPHISVGSKDTGIMGIKLPTFSIDWYAKGGYFDGASVIGVGEAGREAVLPLENKKNMRPYAQAVAALMDDMSSDNKGSVSNYFNIASLVVREEADVMKISEELYRLQRREKRRRGVTD